MSESITNAALGLSICLLALNVPSVWAQADNTRALSLREAELLALQDDPGIARFAAKANAFGERSVAEGQLPDPKLRFGMLNFPTDTFDRTQEPMTQILVGVQQAFPRGNSLAVKTRRSLAMSSAEQEKSRNQRRVTLREVRLSWYELFYWWGAETVVKQNQDLFEQLVEVTQHRYAVGKRSQHDVIRARLEFSMLDDRLERIRTRQDQSRAELARWIGSEAAQRMLVSSFPELPSIPPRQQLVEKLVDHPMIKSDQNKVKASQEAVALAREGYKPEFSLGVNYGIRGGENPDGTDRADFFTALVTVDLPIFRDKRQDKRLSASQYELQAAQLTRDERMLELREVLEAKYSQWERLGERLALYRNSLITQAKDNAQAALLSYQSDTGDFADLMRARITELDTQLKALRIQVDRAKAHAQLRYLAGEPS